MRDYFESVGLAHRREKETRAFPIIVTGDPVTRISTRFAPLENSTQKCAAKTPLTRRESFIDRRRRSSHSSSIYPQLVFSFFPPRIRTYSLLLLLLERNDSFSSPLSRFQRSLLWIFVSRGRRGGNERVGAVRLGGSWGSTRSTGFRSNNLVVERQLGFGKVEQAAT